MSLKLNKGKMQDNCVTLHWRKVSENEDKSKSNKEACRTSD